MCKLQTLSDLRLGINCISFPIADGPPATHHYHGTLTQGTSPQAAIMLSIRAEATKRATWAISNTTINTVTTFHCIALSPAPSGLLSPATHASHPAPVRRLPSRRAKSHQPL